MAVEHSESSDAWRRPPSRLEVQAREMAIFHARPPALHSGCAPSQPGVVFAWQHRDRGDI